MDTGQDMFNLATRGEIQIAHFVQHFVHFVVDFVPNIVHFVQQHTVHFSHFAQHIVQFDLCVLGLGVQLVLGLGVVHLVLVVQYVPGVQHIV